MIWMIVLLILLVFAIVVFIIGYNSIVSKEQNVKRAFSDIDVWIKRVGELVPNLVNTLKGSAIFERKVLTDIAKSYENYAKTLSGDFKEKVRKANEFLSIIYPIVLQLPNFPELKSVKNFEKMMEELRVSMDKIAYARQYYNQAVQDYNTYISKIPWVFIARIMGKTEYPYIKYERREEVEKELETGEITKELREF